MVSDAGQSIYGWPLETADNAFGVTWAGSEAGFDALALARTDLGLPLDEITLANRRSASRSFISSRAAPRAARDLHRHLRETAHASVLVFSTGEKSLAEFIGKSLQEGRASGSSMFLPKCNRAVRSRRSARANPHREQALV